MSKVDQIKSILRASGEEYISKDELERMDYVLETMLSELASTANMDQSKVEESITKFELTRGSDGRSTSVSYARRQPGLGHLPWPLNCHKTITLCWPEPINGKLYCIEIEIPWPCPELVFS